MSERLIGLAALSGGLAVIAGAFAAHGASGTAADWLKTGAQYQLVHALGALIVARWPTGRLPAILFLAGGALFAGTLYAMALGAPHWLGAVTPLGGLAMIAGWIALAIGSFRQAP